MAKSDFWGQIFQKSKSEKTFPRYTYFDGFGKFLVTFVLFFTLVKNSLGQNNFLAISQKYDSEPKILRFK